MPAAFYNIRVEQDCDYTRTFSWASDGVLVPLAGYTAAMKVRAAPDITSAVLLSLTQSSGIALASTSPNVTVTITKAQTLALPPGNYFYDLRLTDGGGISTKFLEGSFEVGFTESQ